MDEALYTDSIYIKKNIGKSRLLGFDGMMEYNFVNDYVFYSSIAFVRGRDISKDSDLPQIPPLNGKIGLKIPVENLFRLNLSMNFAADQMKIGEGEKSTGGFAYYDLHVQFGEYKIGIADISIIAGIQNIFNKKYREHLSTYRGLERLEPGRNIFAKFILNL